MSQFVRFHPHIRSRSDRTELEIPAGATLRDRVIAAIRTVFDPELPVNIYDLGLIYEIEIRKDRHVHVRMTLTAPACPVAEKIPAEVAYAIRRLPDVEDVDVELVWSPPWSKECMSDEAKLELGMI